MRMKVMYAGKSASIMDFVKPETSPLEEAQAVLALNTYDRRGGF